MNTKCWLLIAALWPLLCRDVKAQRPFGSDTLKGVTVTAGKPLVTRKADRYVINVAGSFLAAGYSALEVFQRSPGLWVDGSDRIRLRGNKPVMVMVNEVVLRMTGDELADYLRSLPSENISRIEVLENPPSEYEAGGGGIVHIILKKPVENGWNGAVNTQYRQQGRDPYIMTGGSLDYKQKALYLQGSYTNTRDIKAITEQSAMTYPDHAGYSSYTNRKDDTKRQFARLGIGYDLSERHFLSMQATNTRTKLDQWFYTVASTGNAVVDRQRTIGYKEVSLQYVWRTDTIGSMLKIIADHTANDREEQAMFKEWHTSDGTIKKYRNIVPVTTRMYSIQGDYNQKLNKQAEVKAGIKWTSFQRDNNIIWQDSTGGDWQLNDSKSNQMMYKERLLMSYVSLEKAIGNMQVKAGLRMEHTHSEAVFASIGYQLLRNYSSFFPSVFVQQQLQARKGNALYFSYTRKLGRPALNELNPARVQFSNYTAVTGNPALLPQYSNNLELGFSFRHQYTISGYASFVSDVVGLMADTGQNNFIEYKYVNLHTSREWGVSGMAPLKIAKCWTTSNSFSLYRLLFSNNTFASGRTSFSVKSVHTISLEKIVDIDAVADYRSASVYSNIASPYQFYVDMGFSKKIWHNSIRARLGLVDIFNTVREKEITYYNVTTIDFYRKRPSRMVTLSLSYQFTKGKKFTARKIERDNNEDRNRMSN